MRVTLDKAADTPGSKRSLLLHGFILGSCLVAQWMDTLEKGRETHDTHVDCIISYKGRGKWGKTRREKLPGHASSAS